MICGGLGTAFIELDPQPHDRTRSPINTCCVDKDLSVRFDTKDEKACR